MEWFRFYDEVLEKRKVQQLPAELFKSWVNLLCLANKGDGLLPPLADVAYALRIPEQQADEILFRLRQEELIDELPCGALEMHNWQEHQRPSDNSNERVSKWRQQQREKRLKSTGKPVTLQQPLPQRDSNGTDQIRTDQIREEKNITPPSAPLPAAPDIRLQQKRELETLQKSWYEQIWPEFWKQEDDDYQPGWKEFKRSVRTEERFLATLTAMERRTPDMLKREPQYRKSMASWLKTKPWETHKGQTPPPVSQSKSAASFPREIYGETQPIKRTAEEIELLREQAQDECPTIRQAALTILAEYQIPEVSPWKN